MAETIFWWIFAGATGFAFIFAYGMAEDLIRQWMKRRRARKETLSLDSVRQSPDPKGNGHSDFLLH